MLLDSPAAASTNTVSLPVDDNITGDCLPNLSANTIPTWYVLLDLTDIDVSNVAYLAEVSPVLVTLNDISGMSKFCKKLPYTSLPPANSCDLAF